MFHLNAGDFYSIKSGQSYSTHALIFVFNF